MLPVLVFTDLLDDRCGMTEAIGAGSALSAKSITPGLVTEHTCCAACSAPTHNPTLDGTTKGLLSAELGPTDGIREADCIS